MLLALGVQIPHDFGMRVPPVINSTKMLRKKLDFVGSLSDIVIAGAFARHSLTRFSLLPSFPFFLSRPRLSLSALQLFITSHLFSLSSHMRQGLSSLDRV